MQSYRKFDEQLQQAVTSQAEKIKPSEDLFVRINNKIESENEGRYRMGMKKRTRGLLVVCALIVLTTATCFAATKIMYYEGGSTTAFETYPSEKAMEKKAGFLPKYIEKFENGYEFVNAGIGEFSAMDAENQDAETIKQVTISYENNKAMVHLNISEKVSSYAEESGQPVDINKKTKGFYTEYMNKCVPGDYVMTEQDKLDEANGTYIFSFGSSEIEINHVQNISWVDGGMAYSLGCYDDSLTKEEMVAMAAELMEK